MTKWMFRLTIAGIALTDEQLDALFEAGCGDAAFSLERDGTVLGFFDREAETQEDAVLSAIGDVEAAGIGATGTYPGGLTPARNAGSGVQRLHLRASSREQGAFLGQTS